MAEKKTVMVLKVDLQCPCCYKKIQKILCKTPQISDRYFDEKANTVMITVVCCSPEKIRDKLICKGGKIIKSIEIKKPPKPKDDKPKGDPKPAEEKQKDADEPKDDKPKVAENPKQEEAAKPKSNGKGNAPQPAAAAAAKPKDKPAPAPAPAAPAPAPIPVGLPPANPVNPCCGPCYEGYGGGPCYQGYGFPPPPPQPCYDGNYGPGYVYGRPCHVSRCDYFSEENSTGCTIM